jgi:hypothetical protein
MTVCCPHVPIHSASLCALLMTLAAQLSFARQLEQVDFSACFIDQFAQRDQHIPPLPRRSVSQVAKLNQNPLCRHCRLASLLNFNSRPLIGNSVRRAESNSPPRSGPRPELRRGLGPDSVRRFFARFEHSSPASGGTPKIHFSGRAGIFAV